MFSPIVEVPSSSVLMMKTLFLRDALLRRSTKKKLHRYEILITLTVQIMAKMGALEIILEPALFARKDLGNRYSGWNTM